MVPTQTGPDFIHSDELEELKANDKFLLLRNYFSQWNKFTVGFRQIIGNIAFLLFEYSLYILM